MSATNIVFRFDDGVGVEWATADSSISFDVNTFGKTLGRVTDAQSQYLHDWDDSDTSGAVTSCGIQSEGTTNNGASFNKDVTRCIVPVQFADPRTEPGYPPGIGPGEFGPYPEPISLVDLDEGCGNPGGFTNCTNSQHALTGNAAFATLDGDTLVSAYRWNELLTMIASYASGPGHYVSTNVDDAQTWPEADAIFGTQHRYVALAINESEGGSWPGGYDIDSVLEPPPGGGGGGRAAYPPAARRRKQRR